MRRKTDASKFANQGWTIETGSTGIGASSDVSFARQADAYAGARASDGDAPAAAAEARSASPRHLTGGEKTTEACIDWLSFTFLHAAVVGNGVDVLKNEFQACTGLLFHVEQTNGRHGFTDGYRFYAVDPKKLLCVPFCEFAFGGENQKGRAYVSMPGTACALVKHWETLHSFMQAVQARITRVDLAADFHDGQFSINQARQAYEQGEFSAGRQGNRPSVQLIDDLDSGAGKTLYVGNRKNGKLARIYEKGKQLGHRISEWVRFEIELHNRDRDIPLDVLIKPTDYFSSQYRIASSLTGFIGEKIRTLRTEHDITLDRLKSYAKAAYGRLIYLIRASGESVDQIFQDLAVAGVPRRLQKTALHGFSSGPTAYP